MKPDTRTVNDLFERDIRYVVPLYQRPYVWDEQKQWEPLWEDLLVLLDHQVANGAQAAEYSHFLGAIVLDQETQAPGKIPCFTVIDGQQRLTTLLLLLSAARSVAKSLGNGTEAEILEELVVNDTKKAKGDDRLKVWPTNVNRAAFRSVVAPELGELAGDDDSNLVQEAYAYFQGKVADWVGDADSSQTADRLTTLRITLSDLVKVVSITLEPGDNAQIIFETLNARGTPLLALDLVKNAVFLQATRQGLDVDRLYDEVWRPELDLDSWRDERRQGRLNRAHGELFLMHWLGMKLRRVIPATELFTTFQKWILGASPAPDMARLIKELNSDARVYRGFDTQAVGTPEAVFFERLQTLDVTTVMPLVLLLFTNPSVSVTRRRSALAAIESWLVRRMLLRLTGKNYNSEIAQLLTSVANDPEHADVVIRDHLSANASDVNRWPTDAELSESLTTRDSYNFVSQQRLNMVLRAIELSLYDSRVEIPVVPADLSIEHLMPQEWQTNWPLPADLTVEEKLVRTQERQRRLHRLGNLTLTTIPMNSSLSNSKWATKQRELNTGSKLLMNAEVIDVFGDAFDEAAIDARTLELAKRVCRIWLRPTPPTP